MAGSGQLTGGELRGHLGDWTRSEDGPLYRRLARALRTAIDDGRLPAGVRLPPERALADELAVSRSTVAASMELLAAGGLVERRQGSGTYVRVRRRAPGEGRRELVAELDEHALLRDLSGSRASAVEFTAAAVDCAPEVVAAATSLDEASVRRWTTGHGYLPLGLPPLREEIAAHLTDRGLPTTVDQVLVTVGAVEAVHLAARLFLEPGDAVAVETPSYVGGLDVIRSVGGRLLGVDVDRGGTRVDQLADLMARSLPHLVYLVADFHNPTGVVMDRSRRRRVAELASEFHVPVLEDAVQRDVWFDQPPAPPIATCDPAAPVLTVGSMSKVFWGGLRIGWLRADPSTVERLGRMKTATNLGTPVIDQLVAARLLPQVDAVAERRRQQLAERRDVLTTALERHLPDWSWTPPSGGLALWVQLPGPVAADVVAVAQRHGVSVAPGPTFGISPREHRDRLRLPFVAEPAELREGVRRLARAWDELADRGRPVDRRALVV